MDLDIEHLKSWIGQSMEAEDVVTPRLIAEYRATFEGLLSETPNGDAPLGLHWCLAPPIVPMSEIGSDGHPTKGGFLPPVPLPRRMWAGGEVESHAPLLVGDVVTKRSTVESVAAKQGRTGPLCFVTVRHAFSTTRGLAMSERHDIVYREAGAGSAPKAAEPAASRPADRTWEVKASPLLLFRYSALTFNGHRIHYDQPYVTGVEGYAGLVVHGPIQAAVCFNMAATLAGRVPRRFSFRNVLPMTAGETFTAAGARQTDGRIACWTQSGSRVCMEGESPA